MAKVYIAIDPASGASKTVIFIRYGDLIVPGGYTSRRLGRLLRRHTAKQLRAAIIRDCLLENRTPSRLADAHFYRVLKADGVKPWRAWLLWLAARIRSILTAPCRR